MTSNPYKRLLALIPDPPEQIGQVTAVNDDGVTVQLPTGQPIRARGVASVGAFVFVRDGLVTGPAPEWSGVEQEV